jgi:hypothetical protein
MECGSDGDEGALVSDLVYIASRYPVLAVPSGIAENGVPTRVQIVDPTYSDEKYSGSEQLWSEPSRGLAIRHCDRRCEPGIV